MSEDVIPCEKDPQLEDRINEFSEILKTQSHTINPFGMNEEEFYESGVLEGSIQRIRGQISAAMSEKKIFVQHILNHMQNEGFIRGWEEAGGSNRYDYSITLTNNKISAVELKGCLDGNNTNISVRPPHAHEFVIWSICQNKGADPRHNVWSGIHTRISADIIDEQKAVDGLVVWDWLCGTVVRKCPKLLGSESRIGEVGPYRLPPPCIYLFPSTMPSPRNNPEPKPHDISDVGILEAMHQCFGGKDEELNFVYIKADIKGVDLVRTTKIIRNNIVCRESKPTPIRRKRV